MREYWRVIIDKISNCRSLMSSNEILLCLEKLFEIEQDGMIAFALGEEYKKSNNLEKALKYFQVAEQLFPLPKYKNKARSAIQSVMNSFNTSKNTVGMKGNVQKTKSFCLDDYNLSDTILVVSCTKTKIWEISPNAPDYVPARYAYKGEGFIRFLDWAEENELENKGYNWMILSGKYGLIEPWHPIGNYNVPIGDPCRSISVESLENQINQERKWRDKEGNIRTIYLKYFENIICCNCGYNYIEMIQEAFLGKNVIIMDIKNEQI